MESLVWRLGFDFGGFGKGWLIDKIHDLLNKNNLPNHIINGGGDIKVGAKNETIYIEHPTDNNLQIAKIDLRNQALASSSNLKRQWVKDNKQFSHIVTPAQPENKHDQLQIYTTCTSCLHADIASTSLLIAKPEQTKTIAENFQADYMLIDHSLKTLRTPGFIAENI